MANIGLKNFPSENMIPAVLNRSIYFLRIVKVNIEVTGRIRLKPTFTPTLSLQPVSQFWPSNRKSYLVPALHEEHS